MITIIITTIITAVIGGIFTFVFTRLNKKLDRMEERNKKRHEESIAVREADRELLLKTSAVTELLSRKYNNEGINGELEKAEDELQKTRETVEKMTRRIFLEHMEEL